MLARRQGGGVFATAPCEDADAAGARGDIGRRGGAVGRALGRERGGTRRRRAALRAAAGLRLARISATPACAPEPPSRRFAGAFWVRSFASAALRASALGRRPWRAAAGGAASASAPA